MRLQVCDADYGYQIGQPLFSDLNFSLSAGDIMAILGPNGVGKTTLLNTITGMLPWQKGQTLIGDKALSDYSTRELWQKIAYVAQARSNAFAYSVLDMVLLGRSAYLGTFAHPAKDDIQLARKILARLEIAHLENAYCNAISGGELQLVYIARALIGEPAVLFLDEPESHLDFKKQLIILDIIERLAHEDKLICVMNTHFPNHALRIANKVLLLGADGTYRFGDTQDVLSEEALRDCFGVNTLIHNIHLEGRTLQSIYPVSIDT